MLNALLNALLLLLRSAPTMPTAAATTEPSVAIGMPSAAGGASLLAVDVRNLARRQRLPITTAPIEGRREDGTRAGSPSAVDERILPPCRRRWRQ